MYIIHNTLYLILYIYQKFKKTIKHIYILLLPIRYTSYIGSLTAGLILDMFVRLYTQDKDVFKSKLGYPHADISDYGLFTCLVVELLATFFLVFMVYSTAVAESKPSSEVYGLTIGGA